MARRWVLDADSVRYAMRRAGVGRLALSGATEAPMATIDDVLGGRTRMCSAHLLLSMADALGVDATDLARPEDDNTTPAAPGRGGR